MRAVFGFFAFLLIAPTSAFAQGAADNTALSLTDLVRELKVALLQVGEASERQHLPKLESAVLEAKTSMKLEGDGKISLWVIELGGGQNNEYASTVTLTLKPPPPGSSSNIAAVHLADALREAIISGARAINAAGQGNPPLVADKLEAAVHFAVTRDASGKVAIKFPPFEVSGGGGATSAAVQTITVTYKE
ncbi:trypco2 family protein [Bradyrhizobium genosp. A]|uniref:trypco2 family protein n=1 Tax=Bradyrhizobium genosp. A TaxID=83626 RepID=UPI003CF90190